jgi:hypothetical protein
MHTKSLQIMGSNPMLFTIQEQDLASQAGVVLNILRDPAYLFVSPSRVTVAHDMCGYQICFNLLIK